jgi:hypothetical protein
LLFSEIPHLLAPSSDKHDDENHPGYLVGGSTGSLDDGLGAFRNSTSFNDISTLLPPMAVASTATTAPVGPATNLLESMTKETKKRAATGANALEGPATKKKAGARGGKRPVVSTKKQVPAATVVAVATVSTADLAAVLAPSNNRPAVTTTPVTVSSSGAIDTPNPLSAEEARMISKASTSVSPFHATESRPMSTKSSAPGSGTSVSSNNSEADFKTIAQAAVTSLIQNAGSTTKEAPPEDPECIFNGIIDTSTAHIKALTGNNWVAACSTTVAGVAPVSSAAESKANNRARRQNLTPDERARQNRDRNREHARNTRLRKKAYVDELKRTLTELVVSRDNLDFEKRQAAQRELEQREVRFRVIEEFLKLRGRNEANIARWAAILEDKFSLTLPLTDFRNMVHGQPEDTLSFEQSLNGVSEVVTDASHFSVFLQSLNENGTVAFQYHCDRKNFFMDGCNATLEWTATSVGAANPELTLKGILRGKFSPASNKLLSASMSFNTGAIHMQIPHIVNNQGKPEPTKYVVDAATAAQVAANQADALLDSLQMPRLPSSVVTVVPNSSYSSSASDGSDGSIDDSVSNEKQMDVEKTSTQAAAECVSE